ncbi:hypothetical protein FLONG3_2332 [Fusarium longipes]|uniref:AB hydrolase-1 domain-containing protein n=1 Tax=Fusarium longipes TaxID=694270 RepID=A0A395T4D0_9HYPO|nr:hypothetical protein FLONG3_2332 [Fusarium longipes]
MGTLASPVDEKPVGGWPSRPQPPDRHQNMLQNNQPTLGAGSEEPLCRRTTFFVNVDWRMGATLATATNIVGQMYVECLEPAERLHPYPVVLIHGDFHTGQATKPDGQPGWASFFLKKGFQVMIVDLPPSGRSNFLTTSHYTHRDVGFNSSSLKAPAVETTLTAPGIPRAPGAPLQYERAVFHNRWPGTGRRGDPIFAKYCASLATLHLNKVERQSLAQNALQALLRHVGKSILVGEGAGGNMTWLAADVEPDLVAAAIAIEPVGPPFGTACPREANPYRVYTPFIERQEGTRNYGLTDIPITYDPPAFPHEGFDPPAKEPLDLIKVIAPDERSECFMQRTPDDTAESTRKPSKQVRQLINIKKVPCMILTAHASSHAMYDWAMVAFMMQAGVKIDWIKLEDVGIEGNGHLMFLETNSDEIAQVLLNWISKKAIPKSFSDMTNSNAIAEPMDVAEMIEQAQQHGLPSIVPSNPPPLYQMVQHPSTHLADNYLSETKTVRTPQFSSFEVARSRPSEASHLRSVENPNKQSAPSSEQTTVSIKDHFGSPRPHAPSDQNCKRPRIDAPAAVSTPTSSSSSLHSSSQKSLEQQQQHAHQVSQVPLPHIQAPTTHYGVSDISMMRSPHPGGPARLRQQENKSTHSPLASSAFSLSAHEQTSSPSNSRPDILPDDFSFEQQFIPAYKENHRSYSFNNAHTTARFERHTGTAEESIAAMTMNNPNRCGSGLSYSLSTGGQPYRSNVPQPQQQQIPYLGQLGSPPPVTSEGELQPISTSTPAGQSMGIPVIEPLFTPLAQFSALSSHDQNYFGGFPQMTPPSPSPMPRQSLNPLTYNLDTGSPHLSHAQQKSPPK